MEKPDELAPQLSMYVTACFVTDQSQSLMYSTVVACVCVFGGLRSVARARK